MRNLISKYLTVSILVFVFTSFASVEQATAAPTQYTDSITFRIDSVQILGNNLAYSVMFKRTNEDWRSNPTMIQDTLLGNVDLYFWMNDVIFDKSSTVMVTRHHPNVQNPNALLTLDARYHAMRFLIQLRAANTGVVNPDLVSVPYHDGFIELCRVEMPLQYVDRNPGLRWDTTATGGQSNIGEPLIVTLEGDVLVNPDPNLILEDYAKIVYACEGDKVKVWAQGYSAGTKQTMSWIMADDKDCKNVLANFTSNLYGPIVGAGQVHYSGNVNVTGKGSLNYEISANNAAVGSRLDTLVILNAPAWLDSMYFQCVLSDGSLSAFPKKSTEGETQVIIRDSVFGWFAASDPAQRADGKVGAHDRTDTIFKCPSAESYVSFFFFGPDCGEVDELIGNEMLITYAGRDNMANPFEETVSLTAWSVESSVKAPNGKCLFKGTVQLPDSLTNVNVWVKSIATAEGCHNGASYVKYDTVNIRDMDGPDVKVLASLTDTTLTSGEVMALNDKYAYTDYTLKSALGSKLDKANKEYQASSTPCTDAAGCADTIIYYYEVPTNPAGKCKMEVSQVVHLSDWYYVAPKVFLQGPYNSSKAKMNTLISTYGYLANYAGGHYQSPYQSNCIIKTLPVAANKIVDWIKISVRDKANVLNEITSASALLLDDGSVCDTIGKPYVRFKNLDAAKEYYIVVDHRNHIITRYKDPVKISRIESAPTVVDFTQIGNVAGGKVEMVGTNIYALYSGDCNGNMVVDAVDSKMMKAASAKLGYLYEDINLDGTVDAKDSKVLKNNSAKNTGLTY